MVHLHHAPASARPYPRGAARCSHLALRPEPHIPLFEDPPLQRKLLAAAALVALPFASAAAQSSQKSIVSFQPLSAMMTVYAAEFERAASTNVTWGFGATYWDAGEDGDELTYGSADVKLRYYPRAALDGFSFGGSLGYASVSASASGGPDESASGVTLGMLLEYQWLLGANRNFSVALGAGAKALFVDEDDVNDDDFTPRYPTARLSIGWAF